MLKNKFDKIVMIVALILMSASIGYGISVLSVQKVSASSYSEGGIDELKQEYALLQEELDMCHAEANKALWNYLFNYEISEESLSKYKWYSNQIAHIKSQQKDIHEQANKLRALQTPKPQPGPGPIPWAPKVGATIDAEISYYTCDRSMTTAQKRMNCPSLLTVGVPRTATGTYPRGYKTLACNPKLWGTEWRINHLNIIARCEDTGGHFGPDVRVGRFDLYVGEATGDYQKALRGQRYTTITRIK